MVPDVAQQLSAIRHMIAKTVMPALRPDEGFAQEQAGLILASLDWLLDVEADQGRYELVEHADQRALLAELVQLAPYDGADESQRLLEESATPPVGYPALHEQTVRLKQHTTAAFEALTTETGPAASATLAAFDRAGRRQLEREQAWFRMTGFPAAADRSVGEVLEAQAPATSVTQMISRRPATHHHPSRTTWRLP